MNKTVVRVFDILDYIGQHSSSTLAAISHDLSIPKSSLLDILNTLEDQDIIKSTPSPIKTFQLTSRLYRLGMGFLQNQDPIVLSDDILAQICDVAKASVFFSIRDKNRVVYLNKKEYPHSGFAPNLRIGDSFPVTTTACGKVFLSKVPWEQVMDIIGPEPFQQFTDYSIRTYKQLSEELQQIKSRSYALELRENNINSLCVSAPVIDYTGQVVGALSIIGFYSQHLDYLNEWGELIKKSALQFSKELGYTKASLYEAD